MANNGGSGILLTPLNIIDTPGGNVLHGMKKHDQGYVGFGEAYFSTVNSGAVKGWKRHRRMTLNIVVPVGAVRFVIYDDRTDSPTYEKCQEVTLSKENYLRLTVPPMLWMAFQGVSNERSILLNIADICHEPDESDQKKIEDIHFAW